MKNRALFKKPAATPKTSSYNDSTSDSTKGDDEESRMIAQQLESERVTKDRLVKSQKINSMLADVVQSFQKMATIVSLQESKIERIDRDTETSETNIKKGKKEISDIYDSVSSKRKLIIKVFLVILVFTVIYVTFLL